MNVPTSSAVTVPDAPLSEMREALEAFVVYLDHDCACEDDCSQEHEHSYGCDGDCDAALEEWSRAEALARAALARAKGGAS